MGVKSSTVISGSIFIAGLGLLVASEKVAVDQERAIDCALQPVNPKETMTARQARALLYKLLPEAKTDRKFTVKIKPFHATRQEFEDTMDDRAWIAVDATSSHLRGELHYWVEGTPQEVLRHEIGHLIDIYDYWIEDRWSYPQDEYEAISLKKLARYVHSDPISRFFKGRDLVVEESAWDSGEVEVGLELRENSLESYRGSRKHSILGTVGVSLMIAGAAAAGYSATAGGEKK